MEHDKLAKLTLKANGWYKAMLYDCDVTLADNMQAHKETYVQVALQQNVMIDPRVVDECAGLPTPAVVERSIKNTCRI